MAVSVSVPVHTPERAVRSRIGGSVAVGSGGVDGLGLVSAVSTGTPEGRNGEQHRRLKIMRLSRPREMGG
jgi:hypothetical protein